MDVIFCRNVLMYFAPEHVKRAAERFYRSLVDSGWLIVSPVETSHIHYSQFEPVRIQDSTFYKKDTRKIKPDRKIAQYVEKETIPYPFPSKKVKPRKSEKPSHHRTTTMFQESQSNRC